MVGLLSEADRAEIAAVVQEVLASREAGRLGRGAPRRATRKVRAGGGEPQVPAGGPSLAEVMAALQEVRQELHQRLNEEAQARQKLAAQLEGLQQRAEPGGGPSGQQKAGQPPVIPGIGPVAQTGAAPAGPGSGEDEGGSLAGAGVPGRLGEGPTPEPGGDPKAGSGGAPGAGPHPSQDPSTVHKLAQANFDLAEALNQNLRDLKMIVDRSQELVARIEELLLRRRRAQQGA